MAQIVLTEEQARIWTSSQGAIEVCDPAGTVLQTLPPVCTEQELAKARAIALQSDPRCTAVQRRDLFAVLEEAWQREGPIDETRLHALVQEWRQRGA